MDDWRVVQEERDSWSHDHPAEYDQRTAELAETMQRADGFILYTYTILGEDEDGTQKCEGQAVAAACPGVPLGKFLNEGIDSLNEVVGDLIKIAVKECEEDGETKG